MSTQPRFQMKVAVLALGCCLAGALLSAANVAEEMPQARALVGAKQWAKARDGHMKLLSSRLEELTVKQAANCYKGLVDACKEMKPVDVDTMLRGLDALLLKPDLSPSKTFGGALDGAWWAIWNAGAQDQAADVIGKVLAYTEGKPIGGPAIYAISVMRLMEKGKAVEAADLCYRVGRMENPMGTLNSWSCPVFIKALAAGAKVDGDWGRAAAGWACAMDQWDEKISKYDSRGNSPVFAAFHTSILSNIKKAETADEIAQLAAKRIPAAVRNPVLSHELQKVVVLAYVQVGQKEKAMAAIKTLYQACPANRFDMTVTQIASMLKKMDGSIARANRFLDYVKFGTVGPDGKPGTEDDTVDPFPTARAKMPPEVANAYKEAIEDEWADTWEDKRCLSALYRYMDEPAEALKCLAEAFVLAPMEPEPLQLVAGDMTNVLIQLSGNPADGEKLGQFLKYGKEGRDGKAGTDDDLTDPRKPYL